MYNPFLDLPKENPNFNHLYKEIYQVDTKNCIKVAAIIEAVSSKTTYNEFFWVTSLDKADIQIEQVIEYFNATIREGESPRRYIGLKDIKTYRSEYGIMDREGKFFPCDFGEHNYLAEKIIKDMGLMEDFEVNFGQEGHDTRLYSDYLKHRKGYGIRHNPNINGRAYLDCERPTEAMLKTEEDLIFFFEYLAKT